MLKQNVQMSHNAWLFCTTSDVLRLLPEAHLAKLIDVSSGFCHSVKPPASLKSTGNETFVSAGLNAINMLVIFPNPGTLVRLGKLINGSTVLLLICSGPPMCTSDGMMIDVSKTFLKISRKPPPLVNDGMLIDVVPEFP